MSAENKPDPARTKACNLCFEPIHEEARVCRHCGLPQAGLSSWPLRHPTLMTILPLGGLLVAVLFIGLSFTKIFDRGTSFGPYRDQLKVVTSKMSLEQSERRPLILVTGTIRNDSPLPWKRLQLDVLFMDASGKLVDVARDVLFDDEPGIEPNTERAFSVKTTRELAAEKYVSYKVTLTYAQDGQARW